MTGFLGGATLLGLAVCCRPEPPERPTTVERPEQLSFDDNRP